MTLPTKAHTFLVSPWIPECIPLLMEIMSKLTKLGFKDVDTHLQLGLERKNYMVMIQTEPAGPKVLKLMKWAIGTNQVGLTNLLSMPHYGHGLQANTYVK